MPRFIVASAKSHDLSSFLQPTESMSPPSGFFSAIKNKITRKNSNSPQLQIPSRKNSPSVTSSSPTRRQSYRPNMNIIPAVQPDEAPPQYTRNPPTTPFLAQAAVSDQISIHSASSNVDGDKFAFLRTFDTVFLIDDSGSMSGSRWRETEEAITLITPICTKYDADGIDVYFLNARDHPSYLNVKSPGTVHEIFTSVRPRGGTPLVQRLDAILRPYLTKYEKASENAKPKPLNIIVITDGEADGDLEGVVMQAAKRLDRIDAPAYQLGIQFFQIGTDEAATRQLKELDDELGEKSGNPHLRDIVDTVPYTKGGGKLTPDGILKVVLGAVNRRLDRNSREMHR
jgi:hypothetical protein